MSKHNLCKDRVSSITSLQKRTDSKRVYLQSYCSVLKTTLRSLKGFENIPDAKQLIIILKARLANLDHKE